MDHEIRFCEFHGIFMVHASRQPKTNIFMAHALLFNEKEIHGSWKLMPLYSWKIHGFKLPHEISFCSFHGPWGMRVVACEQALLLPKSCKYCRQMTGKMNIFMAVVYKRLPRVPIYNTDWWILVVTKNCIAWLAWLSRSFARVHSLFILGSCVSVSKAVYFVIFL